MYSKTGKELPRKIGPGIWKISKNEFKISLLSDLGHDVTN